MKMPYLRQGVSILQPAGEDALFIIKKYAIMPSQINLQITGRVQNMVFYKRGDKYYARSRLVVSGRPKPRKSVRPNLAKHRAQEKSCGNNFFR